MINNTPAAPSGMFPAAEVMNDRDAGAAVFEPRDWERATMAKFKWTCEIEVDEVWVADGFDLTAERLKEMVLSDIGYAFDHEVKTRIIKSPATAAIRKAQGYETTPP